MLPITHGAPTLQNMQTLCQIWSSLKQCQQPDTPPRLSLPFTDSTYIVLHGNQMINQWTHLRFPIYY